MDPAGDGVRRQGSSVAFEGQGSAGTAWRGEVNREEGTVMVGSLLGWPDGRDGVM